MPNIRFIISSTVMTIKLNNLKHVLLFAMNIKIKGKGNLMSDVYINASVADIWNDISANTSASVTRNGFSKVSQTGRKVTLVVFNHKLSKKLILIGA